MTGKHPRTLDPGQADEMVKLAKLVFLQSMQLEAGERAVSKRQHVHHDLVQPGSLIIGERPACPSCRSSMQGRGSCINNCLFLW